MGQHSISWDVGVEDGLPWPSSNFSQIGLLLREDLRLGPTSHLHPEEEKKGPKE